MTKYSFYSPDVLLKLDVLVNVGKPHYMKDLGFRKSFRVHWYSLCSPHWLEKKIKDQKAAIDMPEARGYRLTSREAAVLPETFRTERSEAHAK